MHHWTGIPLAKEPLFELWNGLSAPLLVDRAHLQDGRVVKDGEALNIDLLLQLHARRERCFDLVDINLPQRFTRPSEKKDTMRI